MTTSPFLINIKVFLFSAHSLVSQKKKKKTKKKKKNNNSVSNKRPPLKYQKKMSAPGAKSNHYGIQYL